METTALVSTPSAWPAAATRSMFARVSGSFGIMVLQLTNATVELPVNCDAMENSNEQRWVKSALIPTINILENVGRLAAESCHVPFAEFPEHPQSHAAAMSSVGPSKACWRIEISHLNEERIRRAVYRSGESRVTDDRGESAPPSSSSV